MPYTSNAIVIITFDGENSFWVQLRTSRSSDRSKDAQLKRNLLATISLQYAILRSRKKKKQLQVKLAPFSLSTDI